METSDSKTEIAPTDPTHGLRYHGEAALIGAVSAAMERASWDGCRRAGAWLGLALFGALRHRRGIATGNIRLAFPHFNEAMANRIARRSMQSFGMTFCEFLHSRVATPQELRAYAQWDTVEQFQEAREKGRGCILVTAHLGNWEVMGAALAQQFPVTVVARPTSNSRVEAQIRACREANGIRVLSKYDSARAALQALRANDVLAILSDQHAGPEGLHLPLFGHLTRAISAPAKLAQLSRATIVPVYSIRREPWLSNGKLTALAKPSFQVSREGDREENVREATARTLRDLESVVRAHPAQWLWLHKRWRDEDAQTAASVSGSAA